MQNHRIIGSGSVTISMINPLKSVYTGIKLQDVNILHGRLYLKFIEIHRWVKMKIGLHITFSKARMSLL